MPKDTLTITDNRTGKSYEVPIAEGTIKAVDLKQIRTGPDDFGLMTYDPAFMNTASCRSAVTYIDGDRGILRYRGYPIDELAKHASFLDVSKLLLSGELPDKSESAAWANTGWSTATTIIYGPTARSTMSRSDRRAIASTT